MLGFFAVLMAILPIKPEPHLVEKWRMFFEGTLTKPLDIFDVFWHLIPTFILILKFVFSKIDS